MICATCMTAGSDMLGKRNFTHVLLDEATQSTEIATLVPIVDTCSRLVLVGDHRQLPPTIQSYKAKQEGLDESLFERFIRLGYPFTMMDIQFRMHPAIAEFPAAQWYDGALANGVSAEVRARGVTLRARWVTLRARGVTLRARWVTFRWWWAPRSPPVMRCRYRWKAWCLG